MYKGRDRRQHARYQSGNLTVIVKLPNIVGNRWTSEKIIPIDFNHLGMSFKSVHKFKPGNQLEFELSIKRERISGLVGTIVYATELDEKYRYGIQFDFSANEHMQSDEVETILNNIERSLSRSHSNNAYRRIKKK